MRKQTEDKTRNTAGIGNIPEKKHPLLSRDLEKKWEETFLRPSILRALEDFHPTPLLSYDGAYARKEAEFRNALAVQIETLRKGIKALERSGLWDIPVSLGEKTEEPPKKSLSFSDGTLRQFYEEGCRLYKEHRYEEAESIFLLLTCLTPKRALYHQMLGMTQYLMGHLSSAAERLEIGLQPGSSSPIPYAYAAFCALDRGERRKALSFLESGLQKEGDDPVFSESIRNGLEKLRIALTQEESKI